LKALEAEAFLFSEPRARLETFAIGLALLRLGTVTGLLACQSHHRWGARVAEVDLYFVKTNEAGASPCRRALAQDIFRSFSLDRMFFATGGLCALPF
jgi:hypothetical protein